MKDARPRAILHERFTIVVPLLRTKNEACPSKASVTTHDFHEEGIVAHKIVY